MDFSSLVPVFTAAIGALAGLGGVAIKGWFDAGAEGRQRKQVDADNAAAKIAAEAKSDAALAQGVAEKFMVELARIRKWDPATDISFLPWFETDWRATGDIALRTAIAPVRNDDARIAMLDVADALGDFANLVELNFIRNSAYRADSLLVLGFDISSSLQRGGTLDRDIENRLLSVRAELATVAEWFTDQAEQEKASRVRAF